MARTELYRFAAASEQELIVFGAARPGYQDAQVNQWIELMQCQQIRRVCCLLYPKQLSHYSDLLGTYQQAFGGDQICWAPIADFQLADRETLLGQILPFLAMADAQQEKVVVHCAGGIGRTGQILAAWLVSRRGFSNQEAIAAVQRSGRNPYEAAIFAPFKGQNPWQIVKEFNTRLNDCRSASQNGLI